MSFKPFKPNNQCCDTGATNTPTNNNYPCGPGWECPSGSECLHQHQINSQDPNEFVCACVTTDNVQYYLEHGWSAKYPIARVDKPRREIAALTTPITPVFLQEFLGRLSPPPEIRVGFVSTGLNNYYGNNYGQSLRLRWRLGLGNPYQSWWPYDASDFPQDWWLPDVTNSWNNFFAECGAAPPRGQGLCCEAQAICAAQKHRYLWEAVQRASEWNTQQALEGH